MNKEVNLRALIISEGLTISEEKHHHTKKPYLLSMVTNTKEHFLWHFFRIQVVSTAFAAFNKIITIPVRNLSTRSP